MFVFPGLTGLPPSRPLAPSSRPPLRRSLPATPSEPAALPDGTTETHWFLSQRSGRSAVISFICLNKHCRVQESRDFISPAPRCNPRAWHSARHENAAKKCLLGGGTKLREGKQRASTTQEYKDRARVKVKSSDSLPPASPWPRVSSHNGSGEGLGQLRGRHSKSCCHKPPVTQNDLEGLQLMWGSRALGFPFWGVKTPQREDPRQGLRLCTSCQGGRATAPSGLEAEGREEGQAQGLGRGGRPPDSRLRVLGVSQLFLQEWCD